jgi:hypothetical protein
VLNPLIRIADKFGFKSLGDYRKWNAFFLPISSSVTLLVLSQEMLCWPRSLQGVPERVDEHTATRNVKFLFEKYVTDRNKTFKAGNRLILIGDIITFGGQRTG